MNVKAHADIRRKLKILDHAKESGNVSKTSRYFGISRETFYKWKRDYEANGVTALINSKPCPQNPKLRIPIEIEEKILHLRKTYYLGQLRISWYLKRYHNIKVSASGIWQVLKRNSLNKLFAPGGWQFHNLPYSITDSLSSLLSSLLHQGSTH